MPDDRVTRSEQHLIKQHGRLVLKRANRYKHRCVRCEFSDLVSAGLLGLLQAHRQFDTTRGVCFSTYAVHKIDGYIRAELRTANDIIHIPATITRSDTDPLVAASIDAIDPTGEILGTPREDIDIRLWLDQLLDKLEEPDRTIVRLHHFDQENHAEIARRIGLSTQATHVRADKAIARLRKLVREDEVREAVTANG